MSTRGRLVSLLALFVAAGGFAPLGRAAEPAEATAPRREALPKICIAPDGRTFATEQGSPLVPMGVNYYRPGTGWAPQVWKQFDAAATREDFARMKSLGVNCVRVFLSYGSFMMDEDRLDPEGLAKFDEFLDIAESAGIYVHPTGPDHWEGLPDWARGDRVADPRVLAALERFWTQFAGRYRGRSAIFAYDLRNEPAVGWDTPAVRAAWNRWLREQYGSAERLAEAWGVKPQETGWGDVPPPEPKDAPGDRRLLDFQHCREAIADEWTRRQAAAIKAADPDALVTVGLIQWSVPAVLPGVQHYSGFRPQRQGPLVDFLEIHFYPLAAGFYDYRSAEDGRRNLAYLESVVREAAAAGRPVVVGEFGWYGGGRLTIDRGRHPAASQQDQARWCRRLVETTEGLACGWLNWGFYDHPEARDVSQLTGLLTVDGKAKVWGDEFRALSRRLAGKAPAPKELGPRPALDWDRAIASAAAAREFQAAYFEAFEKANAAPKPPGY